MDIIELNPNLPVNTNEKAEKLYVKIQAFLTEIRLLKLSEKSISEINQRIKTLNEWTGEEKKLKRALQKMWQGITTQLAKHDKYTIKGYHQNQWMILGMSIFGVPMGVAFGTSMENMGLLGIGLPIGMAIGLAVGAGMDKKAEKEGRQLNFTY